MLPRIDTRPCHVLFIESATRILGRNQSLHCTGHAYTFAPSATVSLSTAEADVLNLDPGAYTGCPLRHDLASTVSALHCSRSFGSPQDCALTITAAEVLRTFLQRKRDRFQKATHRSNRRHLLFSNCQSIDPESKGYCSASSPITDDLRPQ